MLRTLNCIKKTLNFLSDKLIFLVFNAQHHQCCTLVWGDLSKSLVIDMRMTNLHALHNVTTTFRVSWGISFQ